MSKGILFFAHNNEEIDYLRQAVVNGLLAQKNLGLTKNEIAIVTDSNTLKAAVSGRYKTLLSKASAHIIEIDQPDQQNIRVYKDSANQSYQLNFRNHSRADALALTPFDETIMLDTDYLVMSDTLNRCWGHNNELMMNYDYQDILAKRHYASLKYISKTSVTMYWATVVYFKKSDYVEQFFNEVKKVRDNYECYRTIYGIEGTLYRNDFSFSIAAHVMQDYVDAQVPQLPFKVFKTFDIDDIHSVDSANEIVVMLEKTDNTGKILTRCQGIDLHIMNKHALERIAPSLVKLNS